MTEPTDVRQLAEEVLELPPYNDRRGGWPMHSHGDISIILQCRRCDMEDLVANAAPILARAVLSQQAEIERLRGEIQRAYIANKDGYIQVVEDVLKFALAPKEPAP